VCIRGPILAIIMYMSGGALTSTFAFTLEKVVMDVLGAFPIATIASWKYSMSCMIRNSAQASVSIKLIWQAKRR
jgi:hypothetical protein